MEDYMNTGLPQSRGLGNSREFSHSDEYGDQKYEHEDMDYSRSRVGTHSRGSGIATRYGDYYPQGRSTFSGRREPQTFRQRGYMSGDDYDRGSPYYDENRGYESSPYEQPFNTGRLREVRERTRGYSPRVPETRTGYRGYSREDYPQYRERYRTSEYPETYRSARSGYMSEHVGNNSGRKDYHPNSGYGNLYGRTYGPAHYETHAGKGPRNYRRSDVRIEEDINDRLTDDDFIDATEMIVAVENGEVILSGAVSDRAEKRRAEDLVESISGVTHVENRLRIR